MRLTVKIVLGVISLLLLITLTYFLKESSTETTNTEEAAVRFNDDQLEFAIKRQLQIEKITKADVEGLTTLNLAGENIQSLEGLSYAENLVTLDVTNNRIEDISILTKLHNLKEVKVKGNPLAKDNYLSIMSLQMNGVVIEFDPKYDEEEIEYIKEICFGGEFTSSSFPVAKWKKDPTIKVFGDPTDADLKSLHAVIKEINELQTEIELSVTEKDGSSIRVYFVPLNDFNRYVGGVPSGNWGYFSYNWNQFEIINSTILVAIDKTTQAEQNHLVREELTQALGLFKDSWKYDLSIFYQGWTAYNYYTDLDRRLIQMLYEDAVTIGMSTEEAVAIWRSMPKS